jgi:AmmeMemoRadiSam system protein B
MNEDIREPQAGIWGFYPINRDKLLKEIERIFRDTVRGPGATPQVSEGNLEIIAGVVPHAGYSYSGYCAAWFYKKLAENIPKIDLAIILGTNHTGFGGAITTTTYYKKWSTPIGEIEVDTNFIEKLRNTYRYVEDDVLAHMREHSVEVQIPFLQYVYSGFKIVPFVVKDIEYEEAKEFAEALHKLVSQGGRRCVVIASSDFTHHGSIYGYTVFRQNIGENVRKLDLMFIEKILQLDTKGFLNLIRKYNATVCGYGAIAIAMEYAKIYQCKAELLKYYHSGDVTGEEDIVVGYAAIAFYKSKQ